MRTKATALARDIGEELQDSRPRQDTHLATYELLTVQDAAALLHVPVSWIYEHTRRDALHALPVVKVGKYVRFRASDLLDYIDRNSRVRSVR
jgi:excisionase family DNA binding protein